MRGRAGSLPSLLVTLLLACTPLLGGTTADIKGKVTDRLGHALPGVTLVVKNASLALGEQGAVTDAEGGFRVFRLPPGRGYGIRVTLPSYGPVEFSDVELVAGQTYTLDVVLSPASEMKEVLRVEGHSDVVDPESVVTSTTFSSEFIRGLRVLG